MTDDNETKDSTTGLKNNQPKFSEKPQMEQEKEDTEVKEDSEYTGKGEETAVRQDGDTEENGSDEPVDKQANDEEVSPADDGQNGEAESNAEKEEGTDAAERNGGGTVEGGGDTEGNGDGAVEGSDGTEGKGDGTAKGSDGTEGEHGTDPSKSEEKLEDDEGGKTDDMKKDREKGKEDNEGNGNVDPEGEKKLVEINVVQNSGNKFAKEEDNEPKEPEADGLEDDQATKTDCAGVVTSDESIEDKMKCDVNDSSTENVEQLPKPEDPGKGFAESGKHPGSDGQEDENEGSGGIKESVVAENGVKAVKEKNEHSEASSQEKIKDNECLEDGEGDQDSPVLETKGDKVEEQGDQSNNDEGDQVNDKKDADESRKDEAEVDELEKNEVEKSKEIPSVSGEGGEVETVKEKSEENDVEKIHEVDQLDGVEAGGMAKSENEGKSGVEEQLIGISGEEKESESSEDVRKNDAPSDITGEVHKESNKHKEDEEASDGIENACGDVLHEKPQEDETENEKPEFVDQPSSYTTTTEQLVLQEDSASTKQSSTSLNEPSTALEHHQTSERVGSGTIYRVQTDYLTRQVIAKQERETYLEEKLSEATRDLDVAERKVKDLQLRLKRFAKDDEIKDSKIRQMEREYKELHEQMKRIEDSLDSKSRNNNAGELNKPPERGRKKSRSKVCVIL